MKKTLIILTILVFTASAFAEITLNSRPEAHTGIHNPGMRDVLYDQTSSPSADGFSAAQDFVDPANDGYDCWGADDFEVPAGETWIIDSAYFGGGYWNGAGPGTGFGNMKIYEDAPGAPGTELFDLPACPVVDDGAGNLDITLTTPIVLTEGIYWMAWQHTVDFATGGQWGVQPHMAAYGTVWYWINPGGGFGSGTDWQACTAMWPGNAGTDLTYAVYGTIDVPVLEVPTNVSVDPDLGLLTWSAPAVGGAIYSDDFESYAVGDYLAVESDDWTTWSNAPGGGEDAIISDAFALSGSNSVPVEGITDLVLIMDNYTTGVYSMSLNLLVPAGNCGYWNLQKTNTIGQEWAFQVQFDVTGIATADAGAAGALTFPFSFDTWVNMELVVDLDSDWCEIWVDGVMEFGYQWTLGTFGTPGLLSLGGLNLYAWASAGNNALCYFDDIEFGVAGSETRDLTEYNVYLDGNLETSVGIDVFEYLYEDLVSGDNYVAGVSAVYDGDESEIVEFPFTYTGVEGDDIVIVATKLHGNYPNPFNPVTNIAYSIKTAGKVTLEVYNIRGQLVKTLVNEVQETGAHTAIWNGKDNTGKSVSSGVYFYKMKAQDYNSTKKMILMK